MTETRKSILYWHYVIVGFGLLVGVALVAFFDPIQWINDAAQYESTARNLRDHGEFGTSCIFYGEHYGFGTVPAPQTVFPPGYPALIAGASWLTGCSLRVAGFGVNLVCFVASGWVLFSLCRRLGSRSDVAFFCSACWLLMATMWHSTWLNLSESTFMFFALLAIRLLLEPGWGFALVAGILAAAGITMRYAGVFLVFAVGLNHAVIAFRSRDKKPLLHAVIFCIPPALALAALFGRNLTLSGSARGGNDYPMTAPLQRVILKFVASVARLFGINRHVLDDWVTATVSGVAVLALIAGTAWFLRERRRAATSRQAAGQTAGSLLLLTFPLIYSVVLFLLEYFEGAGMTDRLMVPVVPFVLAAVSRFVSQAGTSSRVMLKAAVGLMMATTVAQFFAHQRLVSEASPSHALHDALQSRLEPSHGNDQTLQAFLQANVTNQHPLLCNEPQLAHGLLKRPIIGLPTGRYNTGEEWSEDRVLKDVIEPYDVRFVLMAKDPSLLTERSPLFFQQIQAGEAGQSLRVLYETRLYTLFVIRRVNSIGTVQQTGTAGFR